MMSNCEIEEKPNKVIGGIKNLLAINTDLRNQYADQLHYKNIKLRESKEGHIATLGRLAKYEDVKAEALAFAKSAGMFINCNSEKVGVKTKIGDYTNKTKTKTTRAHFSIYDSYIGSVKDLGTEPVFYDGNFLYKTYEEQFAKWVKAEVSSFVRIEDLFDFESDLGSV